MMKTTTFSKIASKQQQNHHQQHQQQQYNQIPTSKSTNNFINYKQLKQQQEQEKQVIKNASNWHSDTNLYYKYTNEQNINEQASNILKTKQDQDYDDDEEVDEEVYGDYLEDENNDDDDELIFSDHAGLFKSITKNIDDSTHSSNNNSNPLNSINFDSLNKTSLLISSLAATNTQTPSSTTTTSSATTNNFKDEIKNYDYLLNLNDYKLNYKLTRLSSEQLAIDFDSINNWSMRLSNYQNMLTNVAANQSLLLDDNGLLLFDYDDYNSYKKRKQTQHNQTQSPTSQTTVSSSSSSSQTTTSWNKLKNSKSNQQLATPPPLPQQQSQAPLSTSLFSHAIDQQKLIKLYQTNTTRSLSPLLKHAINLYSNFSSCDETTSSCNNIKSLQQQFNEYKQLIQQQQQQELNVMQSSSSNNKRLRKKLSKSPTITFGELKQRRDFLLSNTSLNNETIKTKKQLNDASTQYPPYLMDQSIQTSMMMMKKQQQEEKNSDNKSRYHKVNAGLQTNEKDILNELKKSTKNFKFFYKSLPDLTFLNVYNEKKKVLKEESSGVSVVSGEDNKLSTFIVGDNEIKLLLLNNSSSSSSIDKQRKTLKSIKRYRQTKQNTEPCYQLPISIEEPTPTPPPPVPVPVAAIEEPSIQPHFQSTRKLKTSESFNTYRTPTSKLNINTTAITTTTTTNSNSSSSSSSSGYISADKIAQIQKTATIKPLIRQCDQQPAKQPIVSNVASTATKVPLKSCLKRKDSQSFSSSNSSETTAQKLATVPATPTHKPIITTTTTTKVRRHNSTASSSFADKNFKILFLNNNQINIKNNEPNSIYIKNIGWLFTCNLKSLKNYPYYKKLNKNAITLAQKYIISIDTSKINVVHDDDDDELSEQEVPNDDNDDDDDATVTKLDDDPDDDDDDDNGDGDDEYDDNDAVNSINNNTSPYVRLRHECQIRSAQSDNDLRNKKCVSFNERISHHTITPPTSQSSPIHEQKQLTLHTTSNKTPLLQYNTLIEMLKHANNNVNCNDDVKTVKKIKKAASLHAKSTSIITTSNDIYKTRLIKHDSIERLKAKSNAMNDTPKPITTNLTIDADSISLNSLSESPPNEFKFSDCEHDDDHDDNLNNKISNYQQQLINDLKIILYQLNELYLKDNELNNENYEILNILIKENLCLIIFNLIKDNLKLVLNEPIIKFNLNSEIKLNELRYEQLCKLFQYLLSIKFIQQQNQYFIQKSSQSNTKQINNNDDSSFILNEANSKQKFEAFIYFFLNTKQLANIFEYVNNDRLLLNKFYDPISIQTSNNSTINSSSSINNSSNLIYLNQTLFNEFIIHIKQLNKYKFKLKYLFIKTNKLTTISPRVSQSSSSSSSSSTSSTVSSTSTPSSTSSSTSVIPQKQSPLTLQTSPIKQNTTKTSTPPPIPPAPLNTKKSPSPPKTLQLQNVNQISNTNNSTGFNLKSLSKKFNIKSWFTSSSSSSSSNTLSPITKLNSKHIPSPPQPSLHANTSLNTSDTMKHSFSEPVINEFNVNFNPNSSKL